MLKIQNIPNYDMLAPIKYILKNIKQKLEYLMQTCKMKVVPMMRIAHFTN